MSSDAAQFPYTDGVSAQVTDEWRSNLAIEFHELSKKVRALDAFINKNDAFSSLDAEDQGLLIVQLKSMCAYLDALGLRCNKAFKR